MVPPFQTGWRDRTRWGDGGRFNRPLPACLTPLEWYQRRRFVLPTRDTQKPGKGVLGRAAVARLTLPQLSG